MFNPKRNVLRKRLRACYMSVYRLEERAVGGGGGLFGAEMWYVLLTDELVANMY
jgi:hypothetical protein